MAKRVPQKKKDAFAKVVKAWRVREGFSQEQAAAELGTVVNNIRNWEQARTMPQGIAHHLLLKLMKPGGAGSS